MANKDNVLSDDALQEVSGGISMKVIGSARVLTTCLNIRHNPDKNSQLMGQTNAPARYDVYEIVQNQGYIWYRIGESLWIANDGTWVAFSTK